MAVYYIEADVHSNNTELAVEHKGKIVQRHSVATTVRALRRVIEGLDGRKHLTLEEGPLAGCIATWSITSIPWWSAIRVATNGPPRTAPGFRPTGRGAYGWGATSMMVCFAHRWPRWRSQSGR